MGRESPPPGPPGERASFRRPFGTAGIETLAARYVRQSFKPHAHEGYLIGVIVTGAHSVWCRGERYDAVGGTVVTMRPGDVHHGGAAAAEGWAQRMLYIGESAMRAMLDSGDGRPPGLPDFRAPFHHRPDLAAGLARLHRALHESPLTLERDTALVRLAGLLRPLADGAGATEAVKGAADRRAGAILDHLHAHVRENVGLDALCALAGLGRRQVIDIVKRRTGLPPHAYHLGLKVRLVQALLRAGVPPAEAAAEAGFADQSHMTRHFAAIVGTTPAAYARA